MSDDELHIANFPTGVSVDLFTALGGLVSAALKECGDLLLAPDGRYGGNAARLVLRSDLTQAQVAAALRSAVEQIDPTATAQCAAATPAEEQDDAEVGHMRAGDDGSVTFGLGGEVTEEYTRQIAAQLAAAMLPTMEAMGAGNYLAWDFVDPQQGGRWELTITKPRGLTPHQARNRVQETLRWIAEAARDRRRTKSEIIGAAQRALDEVKAPRDEAAS